MRLVPTLLWLLLNYHDAAHTNPYLLSAFVVSLCTEPPLRNWRSPDGARQRCAGVVIIAYNDVLDHGPPSVDSCLVLWKTLLPERVGRCRVSMSVVHCVCIICSRPGLQATINTGGKICGETTPDRG
jgi:hypothetical protein